ncbi:gamma-tubulin complex component protein, partial [Baffinella frigidus]
LVERVVPLAQYYLTVVRFTELRQQYEFRLVLCHGMYEFGLVNHALCSAMDEMLREYLILIAQLESEAVQAQLTLQRVWFYIQPAMQTLRVLSNLCLAIETNSPLGAAASRTAGSGSRALRGGALLNVLIEHSAAAGGEQHSAKLFEFLVERAATPYLGMLEKWLYQGVVDDPYRTSGMLGTWLY